MAEAWIDQIEDLLRSHGAVKERTKKHKVWRFPDGRMWVVAGTPQRVGGESQKGEVSMAELNPNAKKWVEALRSGKYEQGIGALCKDGRYCCLGVAVEVARDNGVACDEIRDTDESLGGVFATVREWVGLADCAGDFSKSNFSTSLASVNDNGKSFAEIADIVESQPKGLFA